MQTVWEARRGKTGSSRGIGPSWLPQRQALSDAARRAGAAIRGKSFLLWKMGLFPLLFYFAGFCLLTYPAMFRFRTDLFADDGDGFQSLWNLWWVRKAITQLHQSPWHTTYLHWPYGITLLGHNLNSFNGFITILLPKSLPLYEDYNFTVIFSFVVAGLAAFHLAHHLTKSYWASIIAGCLFTYSSFHFTHLEGHLQMVSVEWIPLFVLLWYKLVSRPSLRGACAAALALFLVLLCDYYFFFYCVLTAVIILGWRAAHHREFALVKPRDYIAPMGTFCLVSLATSGVLVGSFLLANFRDPFVGAHPADEYSLDLLAPLVYGGHWRFASLTRAYWESLPGNINESSVHLGLGVIILLVYVWRKKAAVQLRAVELWFLLLLVFGILALGPVLHVAGVRYAGVVMPYGWMADAFPPLRLSGVPVRMMVMVTLAAAIIAAAGLQRLWSGSHRSRILAAVLVALICVEHAPKPITTTKLAIPPYVAVLQRLPDGAVLDAASSKTAAMAYQTVHEKPLAFGYLARLPRTVDAKDHQVAEALGKNRFESLWKDDQIRYLVAKNVPAGWRQSPAVIWTDGQVWVINLATASNAAQDCCAPHEH